jgi:hypothetical protein
MSLCGPDGVTRGVPRLACTLFFAFLLALFLLADCRSASALPACARKYGMPCSSCHEAWPKLSPFGQAFKDNGYQMGNDRDAALQLARRQTSIVTSEGPSSER